MLNTSARLAAVTAIALLSTHRLAFGGLVEFTAEFPGGLQISLNGGSYRASGPIKVVGIVDDSSLDIEPSVHHGEFPLVGSARFTGAGFVDVPVTSPLSLLAFDFFGPTHFAFQLLGEFNTSALGWNELSPFPDYISNVNDLGTLGPLPFSRMGKSTFWTNNENTAGWTLGSGDKIRGNLGVGGPDGIFSIRRIPEPTTLGLSLVGTVTLWRLQRVRQNLRAPIDRSS